MKKNLLLLVLLFLIIGCSYEESTENDKGVNIDILKSSDNVFEAGSKLMALSIGLHELETSDKSQETLVISVHGNSSRGYEWIYPLQAIDTEDNLITFFRWDDSSCIKPSIQILNDLIKKKLRIHKNIKNIILFGHSYGGLLVVNFMEQWKSELPLEIHTIAAPLQGIGSLSRLCNYRTPKVVQKKATLYEWRTIHKLDGAFQDLNFDPQNVEIIGSNVTRLPEKYKNNKLGHNWSISWVADNLMKDMYR